MHLSFFAICSKNSKTNERKMEATSIQTQCQVFKTLQRHIGERILKMLLAGEEETSLEPRNDVLTTCKAVTLCGDQRIIAVFSHSKYFRSEKRTVRENNSCLFAFFAYRICPLPLKLQNASYSHFCRPTTTRAGLSIGVFLLTSFSRARASKD